MHFRLDIVSFLFENMIFQKYKYIIIKYVFSVSSSETLRRKVRNSKYKNLIYSPKFLLVR